MPGLLCGSNLERAQGILDDRSRGDICVVCCWGLVAVYVLLQGGNGRCMNVVLLDGIVGPSVALGIGVGAGLSLHFLRKWRFLSVILPEPSTLILYWRSGRAEIIFPVVFYQRLSGFWMVTVSPACNGHRLWVCLLYLSTNLALCLWRISSQHCAAAIHSGCVCRGMVGVFLFCRMARAALSLSREPWASVFPLTILFAVFTASSARPLDWGYVTEDRLCFTPHVWRNPWNAVEVNGWPPSVLISSGVPYVWNSCR